MEPPETPGRFNPVTGHVLASVAADVSCAGHPTQDVTLATDAQLTWRCVPIRRWEPAHAGKARIAASADGSYECRSTRSARLICLLPWTTWPYRSAGVCAGRMRTQVALRAGIPVERPGGEFAVELGAAVCDLSPEPVGDSRGRPPGLAPVFSVSGGTVLIGTALATRAWRLRQCPGTAGTSAAPARPCRRHYCPDQASACRGWPDR